MSNNYNPKSKFLKKICSLLVKCKLCPDYFLSRKCTTINVNLMNNQPNIVISIQNCKMLSLVDTGSFFSILPSKHFQQLNIPSEHLDRSKNYSIQSATNLVTNAVQGTIHLLVIIDNVDGTKQKLTQKFLILRADLGLNMPLLGSDFLRANKSVIQYGVDKILLVLINQHVYTLSDNRVGGIRTPKQIVEFIPFYWQ